MSDSKMGSMERFSYVPDVDVSVGVSSAKFIFTMFHGAAEAPLELLLGRGTW